MKLTIMAAVIFWASVAHAPDYPQQWGELMYHSNRYAIPIAHGWVRWEWPHMEIKGKYEK